MTIQIQSKSTTCCHPGGGGASGAGGAGGAVCSSSGGGEGTSAGAPTTATDALAPLEPNVILISNFSGSGSYSTDSYDALLHHEIDELNLLDILVVLIYHHLIL